MPFHLLFARVTPILLLVAFVSPALAAFSELDRSRALRVLKHAHEGMVEHYYDPALLPTNLPSLLHAAEQAIAVAQTNNQAYGAIATYLGQADVRHLRLLPPERQSIVQHDWAWALVGDSAFVRAVDEGSEAEKLGMKPGDLILQIEGLPVNRATFDRVTYAYLEIAPRPTLRLRLQTGEAEPRWIEVPGHVRRREWGHWPSFLFSAREQARAFGKNKPAARPRLQETLVWRPTFRDLTELAPIRRDLKQADSLILDLRCLFLGSMEDIAQACALLTKNDFAFCSIVSRKKTEVIRVRGTRDAFTGPVVVLVDNSTGGAVEVMAHVLRREGRAILLGETSAGRFRAYSNYRMVDNLYSNLEVYGLLVPTGRVLVDAGVDFDGRGIAPDWQLLPTATQLAAKQDVVMAKAFALLKKEVSPEHAGKIYE